MQSSSARPAREKVAENPVFPQPSESVRQTTTIAVPADLAVWRQIIICMRPHQWVKNLFVLAPLLFGRRIHDPGAVVLALIAFTGFCLLSSSLYLVNDVIDAKADRAHHKKRHRPVASGALPKTLALYCSGVLFLAAVVATMTLGVHFLLLAGGYFFLMVGYCLALKRFLVVDCMVIASGFVMRVVSGAVAIRVEASHWLIVCAFLLALVLGFAKRRQELLTLAISATEHRPVLGQYTLSYLDQVNNILLGATMVSYMLYTVAPETIAKFGTDRLIYGAVFVVYGLLRYMALIQNPNLGGDPSKLLVRDRPLQAAILGWAVFNALVIYHS